MQIRFAAKRPVGDHALALPIAGTALSSRRAQAALEPATDVDPALVGALGAALAREQEPGKAGPARLLRGPDGLVLSVEGPLSPAELAGLAARLLPQVRAVLPPGGLDLSVGAGPGLEIPVPTGGLTRTGLGRRLFGRARLRPDR